MATVDQRALAIADEYTQAALALAEAQGVADTFLSELGEFAAFMMADETFTNFMESPVLDADTRDGVLERTCRGKMNDLLLDTLLVLNRRGRAELVPLFHERFRRALERKRNEVEVLVTTAHPLTAELRERLIPVLARHTGRTPRLVETVDPAVIAGVRVQIEDELLDNTAASHLRRLRGALLERASRDLHEGKLPVKEK
ncbi:MAG: ATP synthase F1 subunit delta [Planctomycetota bacterium]